MKYNANTQEVKPGCATEDDLVPHGLWHEFKEYAKLTAAFVGFAFATTYVPIKVRDFFEECREANAPKQKIKSVDHTPIHTLDDIRQK